MADSGWARAFRGRAAFRHDLSKLAWRILVPRSTQINKEPIATDTPGGQADVFVVRRHHLLDAGQNRFFRAARSASYQKSLSIFATTHPYLAGADSCPLSAFGSHLNGQLRTRPFRSWRPIASALHETKIRRPGRTKLCESPSRFRLA